MHPSFLRGESRRTSRLRRREADGSGGGANVPSSPDEDDDDRRRKGFIWLSLLVVVGVLGVVGIAQTRGGGDSARSSTPAIELKGKAKKKKKAAPAAPPTPAAQAPTPTVPVQAQGAAPAAAVPTELAAPAGSSLMMDSAFRSAVNGFAFPNWAGAPSADKIDASVMVALFGASSVCATGDANSCVLFPAAKALADQLNDAIQYGRCEGMAVLSERYFLTLDDMKSIDPSAVNAYMIKQPNVLRQIAYWWATQVAPPVAAISSDYRKKNPSDIVKALSDGMKAKAGFSMGLYTSSGAHSVTPLAITKLGDEYRIHVYDNNYPNEIRAVVVNATTQTWTYQGGATSGSSSDTWTGTGPGTLDITPMAQRVGPFAASFADPSTKGATAQKGNAYTIIVTPSKGATAPVGVTVNVGGVETNTLDPQSVAKSPLTVRAIQGGSIVGYGVYVKVPVGQDVTVVPASPTDEPVTISVDRRGESRVDAGGTANQMVLKLDGADNSAADTQVQATGKTEVAVKVSYGDRAASVTLDGGQQVKSTVETVKQVDVPAFVVEDSKGKTLISAQVPGQTTGGRDVIETKYTVKASGQVVETEVKAKSEKLNSTVINYVDEVRNDKTDLPKATTTTVAATPTTTEVATTTTTIGRLTVGPIRGGAATTTTTTEAATTTTEESTTTTTVQPSLDAPVAANITAGQGVYKFQIQNYSPQNTYTFTTPAGVTAQLDTDPLGYVTVSGVPAGQQVSVTVNASRDGFSSSSTSVTGTAWQAGVPPVLGDPVPTSDGFTTSLTPVSGFTYNVLGVYAPGTTTALPNASASITGNIVTVIGLDPGVRATVAVESVQSGYVTTSAAATSRSLVKITFDPTSLTTTYNGTAQSPQVTVTPTQPSWKMTYTDANNQPVASPTNAGTYTVKVDVDTNTDGYVGSATATFTIKKADLTVSATQDDVTYSPSASAVAPSVAFSGLASSDQNDATQQVFSYVGTSNANVPYSGTTAPTEAGDYTVVVKEFALTNNAQNNYNWTIGDATSFKIKRASQTVSLTDRPTTAIQVGDWFTVSATASSSVTITVDGGCTYDDNGRVTLTSTDTCTVTASAVQSANYEANSHSFTVTAGLVPITVTAQDLTITYGDTIEPKINSVSGLVSGDTVAAGSFKYTDLNGIELESAPTNVGTYLIVPTSISFTPTSSANNYDWTPEPGTLKINPLTVTVTPGSDQGKTYGENDPVLTYDASPALVTGDSFSGALSRTDGEDVGPYDITQGDLKLSSNYTLVFTSDVKFLISKLSVTVTPKSGQHKTYGENDPVLTYDPSPALVTGDSFSGALSRTDGEDVGPYDIKLGDLKVLDTAGNPSNNYVLKLDPTTVQFMIDKLTVTVKPDSSQHKTYGENDPVLTYDPSPALVTGDTFSGALSRTDGEDAGPYDITQGDLELSSNYTLVFTSDVKFWIDPLSVTVTPKSGQHKTYGSSDPVFEFTNDPALVTGDSFSGALSRTDGEDVGPYDITLGTLSLSNNYVLKLDPTTVEFTIDPLTVTVTPDSDQHKTYGADDPTLTYTWNPASVPASSFTGGLIRVSGEDVGRYKITLGSLEVSDNYTLAFTDNVKFEITKAPQTITFDAIKDTSISAGSLAASASSTSGLTVQMSSTTQDVCKVKDFTVALLSVGSCTINADQSGDKNWQAAETVSRTFEVMPVSPTFDAIVREAHGFKFRISNYDTNGTYSFATSNRDARVVQNSANPDHVDVSNLFDGAGSTITVTVTLNGVSASADVTSSALLSGKSPLVSLLGSASSGFTAQFTKDSGYDYSATVLDPSSLQPIAGANASIDGSAPATITVSGLAPGARATVRITSSQDGHVTTTQDVTGRALVEISLSNMRQTYDGTVKSPTASTNPRGINTTLTFTDSSGNAVRPVDVGQYTVTASVATNTDGYQGSASGTFEIVPANLTVTVSAPSSVTFGSAIGASATVTGLSDDDAKKASTTLYYEGTNSTTYQKSSTPPTAVGDYVATATVNLASFANYNTPTVVPASFSIVPQGPTTDSVVRTAYGFKFRISNFNSAYAYSFAATNGATAARLNSSDSTGYVEVTGLSNGASSTVTITATLNGVSSEANITGSALLTGAKPKLGSASSTSDGFSFVITKDSGFSYSATVYEVDSDNQVGGASVVITDGSTSATVTVSGLAGGKEARVVVEATRVNYVPESATATGRALVGVTIDPNPRTTNYIWEYNGEVQTPTWRTNPTVNASVTYVDKSTGATLGGQPVDAGSYQMIVTVSEAGYSGSATKDFTISAGTLTVDVTKAAPATVPFGDAIDVRYSVSGFSGNDSGSAVPEFQGVSGTSYERSTTPPTKIGHYKVMAKVTFTGSAKYYNYTYNDRVAFFDIVARPVTVTASSASVAYGTAFSPSITTTPLAGNDSFGGVTYTFAGVSPTSYGPTSSVPTNAGTYTVVPAGGQLNAADPTGYGAVTYANGTLTIAPKAITVTVRDQSKIYGDADPSLTYTYAGTLVGSDAFSGSLTRDAGSNVGTYKINSTLALSSNYALTVNPGTFTVTPKAITVTADPLSKVYGAAEPTLTYTHSGTLVGTDTFSGSLTRVAGSDVGTYAINQGTLSLGSNYAITFVSKNLTITQRAVTVTADAKSKAYGDADPSLTYQITTGSKLSGDSFTGSLARAAGTDVGTYAINQGTLSLGSNYAITFVSKNLTITQRAVTVTADDVSKTQGSVDPPLTYSLTSGSLAAGDAFMGALTRDSGSSIGTYTIRQGTLALSGNYAMTFVNGTFTIVARR